MARLLLISIAGVMLSAIAAGAAPESYEIDLKELRRTPVRSAKERQPPRETKESVSETQNTNHENSIYTVRPGDHLFLILMGHYGLSNRAAEKLIPEIMHLNGIRKAEILSVGQRLTIPLTPSKDTAADKTSQRNRQKSISSQQPESGDRADAPHVRVLLASASKPCQLAGKVAKQLGVLVPSLSPMVDEESVSVSKDTLKMVVVCGLAPAESYTLERLLAMHGLKLLLFKADETPRKVIEGLADRLGISFRLANPDNATELPLTYFFPTAIAGKGLMLTIRHEIPTSN
jgi:hypothetical protein